MTARIHAAGLAIAADGSVLLNVSHVAAEQDPARLLARALAEEGELFVGVALRGREVGDVIRLIEDRAAEAAAVVVGRRQRRRRVSERKNKRRGS